MASRKALALPAASIPWLVPFGLLIGWQVGAGLGWISSRILPAPWDIGLSAVALAGSGELWHHLGISLQRALAGFVVGGSIGLVLGFLTGTSHIAEKLLDTSVQMVRNVPHLALTPLVILWFGIGEEAKLFLIALGVMFPIYLVPDRKPRFWRAPHHERPDCHEVYRPTVIVLAVFHRLRAKMPIWHIA